MKDIQNRDLIIRDDKNVREYIIEYLTRAKSDQISTFAIRLGINEAKLRNIMEKHVTEDDINAFGQYDELIVDVDIDRAKQYFDELDSDDIPKRKIRARLDAYLRKFILEDGFDI